MIKIDKPIIVEGKYDKIKLSSILDAKIITTDGFGIFKADEKLALIKKLALKTGIIVITDSDGAGLVIRNYFNSVMPKDKIIHLYIPQIFGKEKRKKDPSKEGFIGVEGIEADQLRSIFTPFESKNNDTIPGNEITKVHFYEDGLSGTENSVELRRKLLLKLKFPTNMSSNALLTALNVLYSYREYKNLIRGL